MLIHFGFTSGGRYDNQCIECNGESKKRRQSRGSVTFSYFANFDSETWVSRFLYLFMQASKMVSRGMNLMGDGKEVSTDFFASFLIS
jgi:hypothetical protein